MGFCSAVITEPVVGVDFLSHAGVHLHQLYGRVTHPVGPGLVVDHVQDVVIVRDDSRLFVDLGHALDLGVKAFYDVDGLASEGAEDTGPFVGVFFHNRVQALEFGTFIDQ